MYQTYKRGLGYVKRELEPYVAINPRLEIVLNSAAHELLDRYNYIVVWYDPETKQIKLSGPVRGEHHFMFTLRRYGRKGRSRIIRAGRLLKPLGVTIDKTFVFRSPIFQPGPAVILDLSTVKSEAQPLDY